jgi:nucleotide-binding universal stress UspA family protein
MTRIVAALAIGPCLFPVAEAATGLATLFGSTPVGVHVRGPGSPDEATLQRLTTLPVTVVDGPTVPRLLEQIEADDVVLAVVGSPVETVEAGAASRLGQHTLELAAATSKPLLVVPEGRSLGDHGVLHRVVVPLDGSWQTTRASAPMLLRMASAGIDVSATHVLDEAHVLPFVDAPHHAYDVWRREFLARHSEPRTALDVGRGTAWEAIEDSARRRDADLIVLAWSRRPASGRARVVRDALENQRFPVMLIPIAEPA